MKQVFSLIVLLSAPYLSAEPITWDLCVGRAALAHPDLIVAREGVVQARADQTSARSDRLPSVDASATMAERRNAGVEGKSSSVGLSASQVLWDGGATKNVQRQKAAALDTAGANLQLARAEVMSNLRVSFVETWRHQELLTVLASIEKLRQNNFRMINLRYEGGTEHKGAYLQAKAKLAAARAETAAQTRGSGVTLRSLAQAMGSPVVKDFTITQTPVVLAKPESMGDIEALVAAHPSVAKAAAAVRAAQAAVTVSLAKWGPTLSLNADAGKSDPDDWSPSANSASASINLRMPLIDFGSRAASVSKARSALRAAQATLANTQRQVAIELASAFDSFKDAWENNVVAGEFLIAAAERNRIAKAQYEVGLINYDNWTIIEDAYVSAQKSALDAQRNVLVVEAAWVKAQSKIYGEN